MAGSSGTSRIPPCLPGYLTDTVLEDKQVWSIPYQLFSLFVLWPVASGWARCDYTLSGGLIYIYYLLSHKDSPTGVFNNPAAQHSLRCYHQIQCWLGHTEYAKEYSSKQFCWKLCWPLHWVYHFQKSQLKRTIFVSAVLLSLFGSSNVFPMQIWDSFPTKNHLGSKQSQTLPFFGATFLNLAVSTAVWTFLAGKYYFLAR